MALTAIQIKNAKSTDKQQKLTDGGGLYLLIHPNGSKYWRLNYRFAGKRKTLALGVYPDVSLSDARERREDARKLLANDTDPSAAKKEQKAAVVALTANSFEAVAREWFSKFSKDWVKAHADKVMSKLENGLFPWLGSRPIGEINAPELLAALRRIENRGALSTAHTTHAICGRVFRYAIATGRAQRDPSADLKGALPRAKGKRFASITDPVKIGKLMRDIEGYAGTFIVRCAFRLSPYLFLRPTELRSAEWGEIDLDKAEWRIPEGKMKKRRLHIVPLATQAVAILREIQPLTGTHQFVFPSARNKAQPMSCNSILAALRNLGYTTDDMTAHGFRHMASTQLNEQGFSKDAIEMQLAHMDGSTRGIYNAAEYLPERRKMMQHWADYLDGLKKGAEVINLHQSRA